MKNIALSFLLLFLIASPLQAFAQCGDGNTNVTTPATYAQLAQQAASQTVAPNAQVAAQKAQEMAAAAIAATDPDVKKAYAAAARAYAAAAQAYVSSPATADKAFQMAEKAEKLAKAADKAETKVVQEAAAAAAESYAVAAEAYLAGDGTRAENNALACYNTYVDAVNQATKDKDKRDDLLNITSPTR
ncbi:MAG: hypothetical protein L3J03_08590 [Desulfobacterales bacterium]|nr:hypothetical protein [Desulfobacterales bacterium]